MHSLFWAREALNAPAVALAARLAPRIVSWAAHESPATARLFGFGRRALS